MSAAGREAFLHPGQFQSQTAQRKTWHVYAFLKSLVSIGG